MRQFITCIIALSILAGCGGGGGSTTTASVTPSIVSRLTFQPNDSLTYSSTLSRTGTPATNADVTSSVTRIVTAVNADSSYTVISTQSNGISSTSQMFNGLGQETAYKLDRVSCTNFPSLTIPSPPYTAGQAWKNTYTKTCVSGANSSQTVYVNSGSVVGIENVTTDAGTFSSYKMVYTNVATNENGVTTTASTCWNSIELDRVVQCTSSSSSLPVNSTTPVNVFTFVDKLIGMSIAEFPRSKPTVARFAGAYALTFDAAIVCRFVSISMYGDISGSCEPKIAPVDKYAPSNSTQLSGEIDVNGNVKATINNGTTFTGKFSTPLFASGTFSYLSDSGPWNLTHN